jgi:phosphoglycolate phosphatase
MGRITTLIFDFDGTLADTRDIAIGELRRVKGDTYPTDAAAIEKLRGMTARQVFKALDIHWWELPSIAYLGRKAVREQIDAVKTYSGMQKALQRLKEMNITMVIASTNSNRNIEIFLEKNRLGPFFNQIYGGVGIFDKAGVIRKIMRKNRLQPEECYYIGDEVRDVEASRRAGVRSVAVTWGYNNRAALERAKPDIILDNAADLVGLLA